MGNRQARGRESELRLAEHFQERGFPHAQATANWATGADLQGTPGLAVEVKSRARLDLPGWYRQAQKQAGHMLPLLVVRGRNDGPANVGNWLAVLAVDDFLRVWGDDLARCAHPDCAHVGDWPRLCPRHERMPA